jgi:hypothetical protein
VLNREAKHTGKRNDGSPASPEVRIHLNLCCMVDIGIQSLLAREIVRRYQLDSINMQLCLSTIIYCIC